VPQDAAWDEPERRPVEGEDNEPAMHVAVEGYAGPLDLLLALARTQKVDLGHISIVALADQYLAFIAEAKTLRLELAGDYLVMAAWLAYLKSRMLLPKESRDDVELPPEEMARRLKFRLARLDAMRKAGEQLLGRKRLGVDVFPRGQPEGFKTIRERLYTAEIFDLLQAYCAQRLKGVVKRAHVIKRRPVWSIKDARTRLEQLVGEKVGDWVQLDQFIAAFAPAPELQRTAMASSFGATLEMAREGLIDLEQSGAFQPIFVRRKDKPAPDGKE
jgi:segregation and condensation protein A